MPPIKVHIDDRITPKKGDAVTPQTSDTSNPQNAVNATTTAQQNPPYPPAQPGAAAVPAATPYVPNPQPQPTPTRTSASTNNYGPPAPQPGAVPVPPGQQAPVTAAIPPPPKAGETPQRAQAPPTTMPPQMGVPPPQSNYTPTKGTMYSPPETTGPTTLNFGAVPAPAPITAGSHPPGYQQNTNAQEMTSAARASLDAEERRGSNFGTNFGLGGGDSTNDTAGNVWNAVKGWATTAGKSLAETEKEVWKRINGDK
ncbi:hypothetical protein M409DRAFT_29131 [Zasmidium cellare ATCC 36951]|uniref:Uncharacterized protein n=1 Tax=Zasmidium cellare ATCC 36951 TaxID=1080233 RepID=A0A6A6C2V3_ZASCE|nr:uncharacterized protein M409DRAFT_29131 [Zasmidium cellare ATCC 36951]KAF2160510.1 hypothetical protein M409DRAFT_29131 [Zasmidium cellare ATCC 36951]